MAAASKVDIHFHLLPGVDDGPATIEESLAPARLVAAGLAPYAPAVTA